MRYFPLPSTCSFSYSQRWPTGVPYTHDQLLRHRRGRYWRQIIDVPEEGRATPRYQYAEYNHGYELGLRGDCQDAEWYIGWLVHHSRGINMPNGFLLGYIHGQHFRRVGEQCANEVAHRRHCREQIDATQPAVLMGTTVQFGAKIEASKPRGKKHKKITFHDMIGEALLSMLS